MRFYLIRLQVTPSRDKEKVRKETGGREISPGVVLNPEPIERMKKKETNPHLTKKKINLFEDQNWYTSLCPFSFRHAFSLKNDEIVFKLPIA